MAGHIPVILGLCLISYLCWYCFSAASRARGRSLIALYYQ